MIVYDCQAHWYPPGFFELCLGRTTFPRCRRGGDGYLFELGPESFVPFSGPMIDLGRLLGLMERNGIDVLVSSSEPLSVTGWQIDEAAEAARVLNEEKARAQQQHPDRYIGLATLPLQDVERALEELEHAVVGLGLRGVWFAVEHPGVADHEPGADAALRADRGAGRAAVPPSDRVDRARATPRLRARLRDRLHARHERRGAQPGVQRDDEALPRPEDRPSPSRRRAALPRRAHRL